MKYIFGALIVGMLFLIGSLALPRSSVAAGGAVDGTVSIDGRAGAVGPFWVFVLPVAKGAALTSDEAKQTVLQTDDRGRFSVSGLQPGDYLVAPLISLNNLKNAPAFTRTVKVATTDFGTLEVPAMQVSIKDGQRIPISIVRAAVPPPPPGFTLPHSGESDFEVVAGPLNGASSRTGPASSRSTYRGEVRIGGLSLMLVSLALLIGRAVRSGRTR